MEKYREQKFRSATRGNSDGWKEEGKQMYFALVEKIKTLRKDPVTGSDFEHRLMVKWLIEKKIADGENINGVTYSTFEEDDKRFKASDEYFMTQKQVCIQIMLAEYEAVMKEEKERERIIQMETYVETEVSGNINNF